MALSKDVVIRLLGDASSADDAIRKAAAAAEVSVAAYKRAEREYDRQQKALEASARQHLQAVTQVARGITTLMGATTAAATAAGLAVPAALVGVAGAFAGIGIAAAAQNDEVRAAFAGLRDMVKDSATEIGQPLADILPGVADRIGASFQRMKPQIIDGVTAATPHVETLTDATLKMAESALPGLVTAAENAGPAVEGLGRFLETTGSATGQFFTDLSEHAPAAGAAMDGLGQVVEELLPILATLIGEGAELAADVLPQVANVLPLVHSGLSLVLDAAQMLGPVLPGLLATFIGFKAASNVASLFNLASDGMALMARQAGGAGGALGGLSRGLGAIGTALPVIGGVIAVVASEWDSHEQALERNTAMFGQLYAAMANGGAAGEKAAGQLAQFQGLLDQGSDAAFLFGDAMRNAAQAERERVDNLTPLEAAQERLTAAERTLGEVLGDNSATTGEVAAAQAEYEEASREAADAQAEYEQAIYGVTQAMIDQANQALAAIDSGFAYRDALFSLSDAQVKLQELQASGSASAGDLARAQLDVEEATMAAASAYGRQQADLSGLEQGTAGYTRLLQEETLGELYRLRDAAGPEMAGAIQAQIDALERSGVSLSTTSVATRALREQIGGLATGIRDVPGAKAVQIDVPTADQRRRIEELGNRIVTLPDGSVFVVANTADAENQIRRLTLTRYATVVANVVTNGWTWARAGGGPVFGYAGGGPIHHYDSGGAVRGPGTGTSDSIVAYGPRGLPNYRLSNGEHIWTDAEVRAAGGHAGVMELRRAVLAGAYGTAPRGPGLAVGLSAGGGGAAAMTAHLQASVDRLSEAVANIRGGATVAVENWNEARQTPMEQAEALTFLARTRG